MNQKISQKVNQTTMLLWIFYGYASANLLKGIGVKASAIDFCKNPYYNDDNSLKPSNIIRGYYYVLSELRDGRKGSNKAESSTFTDTCST